MSDARSAVRPPFDLFTASDAEALARRALPAEVYDFVAGGAGSEAALRRNRRALDATIVTPRVLPQVDRAQTHAALLRTPAAAPMAVAPMAYQRLVDPRGELALARAARRAGIPYVAAMLSSYPLEEITAQGARTWLQVYWLRDRAVTEALIERAEAAGVEALVVTVDVPRMGRRLRDMRNGFRLPEHVRAANLTGGDTSAHTKAWGASALMVHTAEAFDPTLSWRDVAWLREHTLLPLLVKGVLHPDDAKEAVKAGADAVIVSNHGGRQSDSAPASIDALRTLAEACPSVDLWLDSGVREGGDVLKALAVGASGALIGRPALWGLAIDGEEGAFRVLDLITAELEEAMMMAGCPTVDACRRLSVGREEV